MLPRSSLGIHRFFVRFGQAADIYRCELLHFDDNSSCNSFQTKRIILNDPAAMVSEHGPVKEGLGMVDKFLEKDGNKPSLKVS
jgi:hypothetical protein